MLGETAQHRGGEAFQEGVEHKERVEQERGREKDARHDAERLADQRRLEEYAKRFAFVAHDVKNVSNQLTLVLANAENRFLWLALATAVLIGVVIVCRRSLDREQQAGDGG